MVKNKFKSYYRTMESPASVGFAITPSDSAELVDVTRAIYVGVTGNLRVDMLDADRSGNKTVTLIGVAAGIPLPLSVVKVHATGTTATSIIGFY